MEGEHWGVLGEWNGFYLNSLSGPGTDNVNLVHVQLTYALLSGERGRLRLHLGASGAFAPELSRVGPLLGVSMALGLLGPLGLEGQVSYTPTPFVEFDALRAWASGGDRSHCAADTTGPTSTTAAPWTASRTPSGTRGRGSASAWPCSTDALAGPMHAAGVDFLFR